MTAYVLRRLAQAVLTLCGVSVAVFVLLRIMPGDPAVAMLPDGAPPEVVAALRRALGVDQPLPVQYAIFLRDVARGDFGQSIQHQVPAAQVVAERLPMTLKLTAAAIVMSVLIAFPLGVLAASRRSSLWDLGAMVTALVGQSVPAFWLGIILILVFAVQLRWLPTSGSQELSHLVLPAVTLSAWATALVARLVRSSMLEVLAQDYVRTARAKGLSNWAVLVRHALRTALLPVVTVLGLQIGALLSGAVVVETVFAWPGVGKLVVDAIFRRDYPVVQAVLLVSSAAFILINLLVDLSYGYLDPRIRLQ